MRQYHSNQNANFLEAISDPNCPLQTIIDLFNQGGIDLNFRDTDGAYEDDDELHGDTALHRAVKARRIDVCEFLLNNGANINVTNVFEETPLHLSAQGGNIQGSFFLLHRGADTTLLNYNGHNVFHCAVISGNLPLCEIIWANVQNINVNAFDFDHQTVLHIALNLRDPDIKLFKFLLQIGATDLENANQEKASKIASDINLHDISSLIKNAGNMQVLLSARQIQRVGARSALRRVKPELMPLVKGALEGNPRDGNQGR